MFKSLVIASALLTANIASAETVHVVDANVTRVTPITQNVYESVPRQSCENIQVPVYETRRTSSANAGDVLGGMILGGLVGKGATGQDNGAAVGAVIGGMLAAENRNRTTQVIVGYRQETQCQTYYETVNRLVNNGYNVEYAWNGLTGTVITDTMYTVGQKIRIRVQLN
jgi:uncharacterized protein YcfJ